MLSTLPEVRALVCGVLCCLWLFPLPSEACLPAPPPLLPPGLPPQRHRRPGEPQLPELMEVGQRGHERRRCSEEFSSTGNRFTLISLVFPNFCDSQTLHPLQAIFRFRGQAGEGWRGKTSLAGP